MKRIMYIEEALIWAYRDELPKQPARIRLPAEAGKPWNKIGAVGTYGTVIDNMTDAENEFGLYPFAQAETGPHPDAVRLYEAVCRLDDLTLVVPHDWNPLGDCGMGADALPVAARAAAALMHRDEAGQARLKRRPRMLMQRCAILSPPMWETWEPDPPVRRELTGPDGRPRWFRRVTIPVGPDGHPYEIEVDGFDAKRRRPAPDAYRKFVWETDPVDIALDRAEWELWRACLDALMDDPALRLETITLLRSDRPLRPWESGERAPRVWQILPAHAVDEKNETGQ
jgi:hypothetical protein